MKDSLATTGYLNINCVVRCQYWITVKCTAFDNCTVTVSENVLRFEAEV